MTAREGKARTRTVEEVLTLQAPVEAVWQALTQPEEIMRWFALEARVEPGPGGSLHWAWGKEIQWDSHIEVWEPGRRLRAVYDRPQENAPPARLAMDFHLEGRGGQTVLRLVHSGFGAGADWDEEYDGVSRGWGVELRGLRHYLEHHRGTPRALAWARAPLPVPDEEAWRRLLSPEGLLRRGSLDHLREGDQYEITGATGDDFQGRVLAHHPGREFVGTVDNRNRALLRLAVEKCGGGREAWVWLAAYGAASGEVAAFEQRWTKQLQKLFPRQPGARS